MAWAPDYVTLAELKAFLRITDTADDALLAPAITAASRAIDTACGRQFGSVAAEERFYTPVYDRRRHRWIVEIDDLMSTAGSDFQLQDSDGVDRGAVTYTLEPRNAAAKGRPWTRLVVKSTSTVLPAGIDDEAAFTAPWGWTAVPSTIGEAGRIQSARFFARRDSPYGIAGSPDDGSEQRLLARLDPDVAVMVNTYRRWWAAA